MALHSVAEALQFCLLQLQQETDSKQLSLAVQTLLKIFQNVQRDPSEEKYRTLKTENKTFHERVWRFTNAQQFLVSTGWTEVDGRVVLLEDQYVDTAIQQLEQLHSRLSRSTPASNGIQTPQSTAPSASATSDAKAKQLADVRRQQYEAAKWEKEEKKRIAEMIKADRRETNSRESKDSHAQHVASGSGIKRFDDIGVNLNRGGG